MCILAIFHAGVGSFHAEGISDGRSVRMFVSGSIREQVETAYYTAGYRFFFGHLYFLPERKSDQRNGNAA